MKTYRYREPHYVYRIYDEQRRCLYVGCSINPEARIRFHLSKPWGDQIHHYVVTEHVRRSMALDVERAETHRLDPLYNLVNTSRDPNLRANRQRKTA